ncbi:MAG: AAA family ATPase, partial [Sulfitobacter sp.]|nr:AAA family ATPase [Sulfitobacter sp.]
AELEVQPPQLSWLIQDLWGLAAVGIIGGAPKCCKSFLGLDMALSVASATPCLGRFTVQAQGPALVFLAEDSLPAVRARLDGLCTHRNLDIRGLNLYVITAPSLRLDQGQDRQLLEAMLTRLKPRILLLDPLVRLHRLDENSAADISKLLGFLRDLQRTYDTAIVLVHHASKKHRAQPGQALRGSSDLHAFGDSNAYLARKHDQLILTCEHRAARAPDPITLELVATPEGHQAHLEVRCEPAHDPSASLAERALLVLQNASNPISRKALRDTLRVNNQRLGEALETLKQQGAVVHTDSGWIAVRAAQSRHKEGGRSSKPLVHPQPCEP